MFLKDVTIIIPTCNRPNILNTNLEFLSSQKQRLKIIILDSSSKKNKIIKKKYNFLEIKYLYFNQNIYFPKKIVNGLKEIKTKFVVFCADDDFMNILCLRSCVSFLKFNSSYSCAQGKFFQHKYSKKKKRIGYNYLYKTNKSNETNSSIQRCLNYLNNKRSHLFYAVTYTKISIKIWSFIEKKINGGIVIEIIYSFLLNYLGKSKVLNQIFFSRDASDNSKILSKSSIIKFLSNEKIDSIMHHLSNSFFDKSFVYLEILKESFILFRNKQLSSNKITSQTILNKIYNKFYSTYKFIILYNCKFKKNVEHHHFLNLKYLIEIKSSKKFYKKNKRHI